MTERASPEVDSCPKCRGVWIDRGELDKIIQRSLAEEGAAPPGYNPNEDSKYGYRYQQPGQPNRKKSVWRELFDF
jgi:Zn-finger nucleic acid-binding protein